MKEFGSDFHYVVPVLNNDPKINSYIRKRLYANGRQAVQHLIYFKKWNRIWMPEYFCYEIVEAIKATGIKIEFYKDYPGHNDQHEIERIEFEQNDVLLRMNYFGLRIFRDNKDIPVEVIEDHSHDLTGGWATYSNADWCIASLRKTLPIPEGGVLWSPKKRALPPAIKSSKENNELVKKRWKAMQLKRQFLQHDKGSKEEYRKLFIETESNFEILPLSSIAKSCKAYLINTDNESWYKQKQDNWNQLAAHFEGKVTIEKPEDPSCNVFSFVIRTKTEQERETVRKHLIENSSYPVILWYIPKEGTAKEFSSTMLSIPCDARYNTEDVNDMIKILDKALSLLQI